MDGFYSACEPAVVQFCNSDTQGNLPNLANRGADLEDMMSKLEKRMTDVIEKNDKVMLSYAQVVKGQRNSQDRAVNPPIAVGVSRDLESSTVRLLDEYADRERRKDNLIVHNVPESNKPSLNERNRADKENIEAIIADGLAMTGVEVSNVIRLGGRGQNRNNKPRLVMATLATPARKKMILAAAKTLRNTEDWSNIYITPDQTPKEREEGRVLREELRTRRNAGEENIVIRRNKIVAKVPSVDATAQASEGVASSGDPQHTQQ